MYFPTLRLATCDVQPLPLSILQSPSHAAVGAAQRASGCTQSSLLAASQKWASGAKALRARGNLADLGVGPGWECDGHDLRQKGPV